MGLGLLPASKIEPPVVTLQNPTLRVPIYILDNGAHIDFAVPMYSTVYLQQGAFAINFEELFGIATPNNDGVMLPPDTRHPHLTLAAIAQSTSLAAQAQEAENLPPPPPLTNPLAAQPQKWCIIGWGQKEFYQTTPTWADINLAVTARAAIGADAALHAAAYTGRFTPRSDARMVFLTQNQYIALYTYIQHTLSKDTQGNPMPLQTPAVEQGHKFLYATGTFSAINTCNTWAARALNSAGVPAPLWTITPWFVMWHLPSYSL